MDDTYLLETNPTELSYFFAFPDTRLDCLEDGSGVHKSNTSPIEFDESFLLSDNSYFYSVAENKLKHYPSDISNSSQTPNIITEESSFMGSRENLKPTTKVTTNNNNQDANHRSTNKKKSSSKTTHVPKKRTQNNIERKRRDEINVNIKCLGQLLPEDMYKGKSNKGKILQGSVNYIKMLEDQLVKNKSRLEYLQNQISLVDSSTM